MRVCNKTLLAAAARRARHKGARLTAFFSRSAQNLTKMAPANMAMVMSTGIVSIALNNAGLQPAARALVFLAAGMWALNVVLLGARIFYAPRAVLADFSSQARAPGFLTTIAGTDVLGSCCVLVLHNPQAARFFFRLGAALWLPLSSLVLFALFVSPRKVPLENGINGSWLLFTVSTQSLVVLGALLSGAFTPGAVLALAVMFAVGIGLYFMIIPIIMYRLFFKSLSAQELSATFWVNAGAMAITSLAGSRLEPVLRSVPELAELAPAVKALAAGAWGIATFWLPCLLLLGVWRHLVKGYRFRYGVEYWSLVFPLGMYTVCSQALEGSYAFGFTALSWLWLGAAAAAWCIVFVSYCLFLAGILFRPSGV